MGEPALSLVESLDNSYSGFGKNVVKLSSHGSTVCIISENDMVWFARPLSIEELVAVSHVLEKKKMKKALHNHDYGKAQQIADKKFHPS